MPATIHHDRMVLDASKAVRRGDGSLVVPARLTRAGVLVYHDDRGKPRRRLRHPEDVLSPERIAALGGLPVTLDHPDEMVTPQNAQALTVGTSDLSTRREGNFAAGHLVLHSQAAIDAVLSGTHTEISPGYWASVVGESGTWDGEQYDDRQVDQRWNHIALVPRGRSGSQVRVMLDADKDHDTQRHVDGGATDGQPSAWMEVTMPAKIDPTKTTDAPDDAATIAALRAELDAVKAQLTAASAVKDAATADADRRVAEAKAEADRRVAEATKDAEARAMQRARIVADHITHVGSEPAADATIEQMQRQVVGKLSPDFTLDGRSAVEVAAIYGYVTERAAKAKDADAKLRGAIDSLPTDAQTDTVASAATNLIAAASGKRSA